MKTTLGLEIGVELKRKLQDVIDELGFATSNMSNMMYAIDEFLSGNKDYYLSNENSIYKKETPYGSKLYWSLGDCIYEKNELELNSNMCNGGCTNCTGCGQPETTPEYESDIFNDNSNATFTLAEVREIANGCLINLAKKHDILDATGFWDYMKNSRFADRIKNDK